jgi:hypothetical protein
MDEQTQPITPEQPVDMPVVEQITPSIAREAIPDAPVDESTPKPPEPAGILFDVIAYHSTSDVPEFIGRMQVQDAVFILVTAATYAHKKGLLNLLESEVVSKAIRVVATPRPPASAEVKPPEPEPEKE